MTNGPAAVETVPDVPLSARARDGRWPPTVPLVIVALLVLCGLFAPLLAPHSPVEGSLGERLVPPLGMEGSKANHPIVTGRVVCPLAIRGIVRKRATRPATTARR